MYSAEGEFVEFGHSVLLEGPVEVWFDISACFLYTFKDKTMTTKAMQLDVKVHDILYLYYVTLCKHFKYMENSCIIINFISNLPLYSCTS